MKLKKLPLFVALTGLFVLSAHAQVLLEDDAVKVDIAEIVLAYDSVIPETRQAMMRSKESNIRGFLLDYFTYKRLAQAARDQSVDQKPDVVMRQQYLINRVLTEALVEDYIASSVKPDFEAIAQEYYAADKSSFVRPEQVHAKHILLSTDEGVTDADVLEQANALFKELKSDLSKFEDLAREYSDDPSVENNGGDLGFFGRGQMVKPFEDAAFSLKKGKLSKPVKTGYGYHIIYVLDKKKEQQQSFEQVREALVARAEKNFRDARQQEVIEKYRENPTVRINNEAIDKLVEQLLENQQ